MSGRAKFPVIMIIRMIKHGHEVMPVVPVPDPMRHLFLGSDDACTIMGLHVSLFLKLV